MLKVHVVAIVAHRGTVEGVSLVLISLSQTLWREQGSITHQAPLSDWREISALLKVCFAGYHFCKKSGRNTYIGNKLALPTCVAVQIISIVTMTLDLGFLPIVISATFVNQPIDLAVVNEGVPDEYPFLYPGESDIWPLLWHAHSMRSLNSLWALIKGFCTVATWVLLYSFSWFYKGNITSLCLQSSKNTFSVIPKLGWFIVAFWYRLSRWFSLPLVVMVAKMLQNASDLCNCGYIHSR